MTKKRVQRTGTAGAASRGGIAIPSTGTLGDPVQAASSPGGIGSGGGPLRPRSISLSSPSAVVGVALLSKNQQFRVEFGGSNDVFRLGDIYLNDLSDIRVFELSNSKNRRLRVQFKVELRKPFHTSVCNFQLENENLSHADDHSSLRSDYPPPMDEYSLVPASVVRVSAKAALCAENPYLNEDYNELFNHIATVQDIVLEANETRRVIFSTCIKLASGDGHLQNSASHGADSSEEERMHLNETSCLGLTGRLTLKSRYEDPPAASAASGARVPPTPPLSFADVVVPLQGQVCRSLLRLDMKELHFDDCIPGGSFVKDFTVWNRSEIPLLFQLVSSVAAFDENRDLLTFTDYNSGYKINEKTVQAAAYGHVRIRVTYRPVEVGERFVEVYAQNLHDSRNVKILKIHAVTNKEHHREGLSIKEPSGSYLMSGSKLDYGDCYTGIATPKTLLLKNSTEAPLHVELTSDRPKEVTFELKLLPNRARASRSARADDIMSPTDSNDGSSRKGSLSPDAAAKTAAAFASFDTLNSYGADSDDDGDENEAEFYEDELSLGGKRLSFEENPLGDLDDGDDDFEFDREPRPTPRSPPMSPKHRGSNRSAESRRRFAKRKVKRASRALSRVRDGTYESGVDSGSIPSSPERKVRGELRRRNSASVEDTSGSNFLVETLDLAPGAERTILVWYCPSSSADSSSAYEDGVDSKASRLSKQTFRVSFRCFQVQGSWQQAQSRVYDRSLGKSVHIRARTCTSFVTVTPSILHLGDCNIGELKSSACVLTNHSELPTVVKPLVTSKVISTVPNDEMTLGPKQSIELKVEIIPRKINPNYTRLISVINMKNKSNIPQVCVRSSNMDAHHVIYHSLFYKLLTPSRAAFLNFDHVAINSVGMQVFDLENITNAPLHLSLQTSDAVRVRLYCYRQVPVVEANNPRLLPSIGARNLLDDDKQRHAAEKQGPLHLSHSSSALNSQSGSVRHLGGTSGTPSNSTIVANATSRQNTRPVIRRRRSFGCESELASSAPKKSGASTVLRGYLSKKVTLASATASSGWLTGVSTTADGGSKASSKTELERGGSGSVTPPLPSANAEGHLERISMSSSHRASFAIGNLGSGAPVTPTGLVADTSSTELQSLLELFELSRVECDRFCHSSMPSWETEKEIAGMVRERMRRFQALVAEKKLVPLTGTKDRNIRISAKSRQRIIAVFSPTSELPSAETMKVRIEKLKIFITLPPGGNKKAVADATRFDTSKVMWATSKHPFDSRPSVRELLVKSRVCRSVMNVNQKNINFGRITVSSRSSKKLVVQNMSAIPLVYSVEKTGSISSAFLEIKEGEVGVVKGFGTKEISFEFQPTLAGSFEEKLKIVNVQDPENSLYVTIKAKVVKRETFKLLQSGQVLSFGKCLAGEKSETLKIAVRNTSRKKREYAIQVDPTFSNSLLRPTFFFAVDDAPSAIITQAQEKKLDEDLEKLEHKLRIAVTKKKTEKITKLNSKISRVKALLSGEHVPDEAASEVDEQASGAKSGVLADLSYDSNSESEFSESETPPRVRAARRQLAKQTSGGEKTAGNPVVTVNQSSANMLTFTLEAEAIGRIVAYAVFQPVRSAQSTTSAVGTGGDGVVADDVGASTAPRSQKARKRQLKKDLAPLVGVGKLLLYEQQNKDVMKELQYNAEVFLRTPPGEAAYYRAVGKAPLPPVPHAGLPKRPSLRKISGGFEAASGSGGGQERMAPVLDITAPTKAPLRPNEGEEFEQAVSSEQEIEGNIGSSKGSGQLVIKLEPNQCGMIRRSTLLVPIEESPSDTLGWVLSLSNRAKYNVAIEVRWRPVESFRGLLCLVSIRKPDDPSSASSATTSGGNSVYDAGGTTEMLPLKVHVSQEHDLSLHLRWAYTSGSGFGSSTSMASCVSSSTLDLVSKTAQVAAGVVEIVELVSAAAGGEINTHVLKTVDVALVKAVKRSLHIDTELVELGQQQQNTELKGQFLLRNRSRQVVKFLLLTPSLSRDSGSGAGGEFSFESSTGKVDPQSHTLVKFTFRGTMPGQHTEQILVRNLSDRLDTLAVNVTARITRPVYVRVPELDPLATGTLEVLDLGPCYVTPEMQDTSVDSPNVMLKFSKVHKLTLLSQVKETLILCASSNLKTQCYVFEDIRLNREATNVVLAGKRSIDLYVAVRPRLPGDAMKTGGSRDLVGGIRMQLFRSTETGENDDRMPTATSTMVAEFTIKFVGVAGVSLSRVVPSSVDFHLDAPSSFQRPAKQQGKFEIVNVSKALPLRYRLFVTSDPDTYSDNDEALSVELERTKGEIAPGESGEICFHVSASSHGLFRRRILVENIQYPGKTSTVDLVLFVDNKALHCEVATESNHEVMVPVVDGADSKTNLSLDLGVVPVVRLEDELAELCSPLSSSLPSPGTHDSEHLPSHRCYRIYADRTSLVDASVVPTNYSIVLTNTHERADCIVRPISTLPLCFHWSEPGTEPRDVSWFPIQPTAYAASLTQIRALQLTQPPQESTMTKPTTMYYGGVYRIPPKSSCRLVFRFAPIAATGALPVELISTGKCASLKGMLAIQSFAGGIMSKTGNLAKTLRVLSLQGTFAQSVITVAQKKLSLGKIGYSLGWRSSTFDVVVKNDSDVPAYFTVDSLSESIVIKNVQGASRACLTRDDRSVTKRSDGSIPLLASLAADATSRAAWTIEPLGSCVLEMEFVQLSSPMSAGLHEFPLKIFNVCNPHNVEHVAVSAQIVSSYAEVTVDPESSGGSIGIGNDAAEIGFLPPVTVPPIADSTGSPHGPSFWFSVKNVFDEELSVRLAARLKDQFHSMAELVLCSRSSNTILNSITVAPGDSVDIRVVCRVHPSARIAPSLYANADRHYNGDLLTFGSVDLDITVQNMKDATQRKEILVRGKVAPGRTFTLSSSSLHFHAVATDLPADMPMEQLPSSVKVKVASNRELVSSSTQSGSSSGVTDGGKTNLYQLRTQSETFWIRNPSTTQPLHFIVDQIDMYSPGLCLIRGSSASEMHAMSEYFHAVPVPSSGSIQPGEGMKITVRLEEASLVAAGENENGDAITPAANAKVASHLHKVRHHPSWRSNSWGAEVVDTSNDLSTQNHMILQVRDANMTIESALGAEVDVHLMLQSASSLSASGADSSKMIPPMDRSLLGAAFAAREKRLNTPKKPATPTALIPALQAEKLSAIPQWGEASVLDHFEEFDVGSIRSGSAAGRRSHLPVLSVRGCTPSENSSLESTRYVIDVGQHTVRNGGEVEWEITVESIFNQALDTIPMAPEPVEYRLYLVDQSASSWFQLSRDRGTLDQSRSYQSVVLYFLRDVIGVYSTFLVLQNVTNPGDLKVIQVKLEVVADLNALRSMTSGIDPATNLFRVLVSNQVVPRQLHGATSEATLSSSSNTGDSKLVVDYGEVYYHQLYHNHSIVVENASSMTLDFMLSSNAPSEVHFSVSPTSFSEVSTVTLGARGRAQVFLHFRPRRRPKTGDNAPVASDPSSDQCSREVEVYVNCRLVKDFRETVVLRAICHSPQLTVQVASSTPDLVVRESDLLPSESSQPGFLGMVFAMAESAISAIHTSDVGADSSETAVASAAPEPRYIVVQNTRSDVRARIALRNDSLFFNVGVDTKPTDGVEVDFLENGICAGRRSTLLVSIAPRCRAVFRITPDVDSLRKHRQMWDHSVKEHITLYNIKQFAEHYQVTLCFTCSNVTSYYIPPHIVESYPFSALEDTIAKFLQNYNATWKWLISYHSKPMDRETNSKSSSSPSIARLAEVLSELENALEQSSPLSPRKPNSSGFHNDSTSASLQDRETLRQLLHSYRALYFDFFYITDELIWYGVRSNAVRHSLMLADLAYGVVFNHEIFRVFLGQTSESPESLIFPRLLLPWSRQLRHFLSYFPENQEATRPLRLLYEQLHKFEIELAGQ